MKISSRAKARFALAVIAGIAGSALAAYAVVLLGESVSPRGSGTGNVLVGALGVASLAIAALLLMLANTLWTKSQRNHEQSPVHVACPNCEATAVHRTNRVGFWETVVLYRLGYRAYRCDSCDRRFRAKSKRPGAESSST